MELSSYDMLKGFLSQHCQQCWSINTDIRQNTVLFTQTDKHANNVIYTETFLALFVFVIVKLSLCFAWQLTYKLILYCLFNGTHWKWSSNTLFHLKDNDTSCMTCNPFLFKGGSVYHRDSPGHEPLHRLSLATPPHPLRPSVCRYRALRLPHRLHSAHHLPPLQGPFAHQGPEGCHRGVPAGCLQVRSMWNSPSFLTCDVVPNSCGVSAGRNRQEKLYILSAF